MVKDVAHEDQVGLGGDARIVGLGEGDLNVAHAFGHRLVVDVADHFGIDIQRNHFSFRHDTRESERKIAGTGADVDDGLLAGQTEGGDHRVGFLPGSPVWSFEKGDVLGGVLKRPQVGRIEALLAQRTVDGRMGRIMHCRLLPRRADVPRSRCGRHCGSRGVRGGGAGNGDVPVSARAARSEHRADEHAELKNRRTADRGHGGVSTPPTSLNPPGSREPAGALHRPPPRSVGPSDSRPDRT